MSRYDRASIFERHRNRDANSEALAAVPLQQIIR